MLTNFDSYLKFISNLFKNENPRNTLGKARYCWIWLKNRLNQPSCKNFSFYDELVSELLRS